LRPAGARKVRHHGADETTLVDAFMLVKAPVLGCDEGFLDRDWNVTQRHPDAAIALSEICEALTSRIENPARLGNTGALEPTVIGQIGDSSVIEPDHLGKIDGSFVFVLAELPVDREEALEFQAVEHFDLARERVAIIYCGLHDVVDINAFTSALRRKAARITRVTSTVALGIELRQRHRGGS
jgi:hypothetical protein